jgi:hypothetical protein
MNRLIALLMIIGLATMAGGCTVATASNPDLDRSQPAYATERARDAQGGGGGGGY